LTPPQWDAFGRDCDKIIVEAGGSLVRLKRCFMVPTVAVILLFILGVGLTSSGTRTVSEEDEADGPQSFFFYGYLVLFFIGIPSYLFLIRTESNKITKPLQALVTRVSGEWTGDLRVDVVIYHRRKGAKFYILQFLVGASDAATVASAATDDGLTLPAASTVADSRSGAIPVVTGSPMATAAVLPLYSTDSHQSQLAALERRRNYISEEEYERQKAAMC
jgi:hypothetical protein